MRSIARFITRFAPWVAVFGTLLAFVGLFFTIQLYKNLRTNFEELLPTTARSVVDLAKVNQRLQSIDNLGVVIRTEDAAAGKRFVLDLVAKLKKLPPGIAQSIEYEVSKELLFFKQRQALFMELGDLKKVRDYIEKRIDYEKALYNPLNIFSGDEIPEPKMDFLALRAKYEGRGGAYERFPDGFYATPDGKIRVVLVNKPSGSFGGDSAARLRDAVVHAVNELKPSTYAPDMKVNYAGGVQESLEEQEALMADLSLSSLIVVAAVTGAMWIFFRSALATTALNLSLFMGVFWTFGVSYFAVGYLNANSAFLGSIVIGNGINFGIIVLARYLEERRVNGKSNAEALEIALPATMTGTLTAALAAGLSYGSLVMTGFRGFRQFGVIGLIGMVLCWISAFTLLPAYLTLIDRFIPIVRPGEKQPSSPFAERIARAVDRFPGAIWLVSVGISLASVATFSRYSPDILETNLSKLRNKETVEHGAGFYGRYLDQVFQRFLTPMAVLPNSHEETAKIAEALREQKERDGEKSLIASVSTLDDYIPRQQAEKIRVLQEIRKILPPKLVHRLAAADQKLLGEFLTPQTLKPFGRNDLPPLVLSKFTEKTGEVGRMVLVEPPLDSYKWTGPQLFHFVHQVRDAADSASRQPPVVGTLTVASDLIEAITVDGPKATLYAFLAVVILVILLFRSLPTISLILFSLLIGVLWLAGFVLGSGLKINFLNFIALPITFGIGIDYGVNIFQRYREEGGKSILNVIRFTGGAVILCSFTTIVGYSSLLIAGNQGFVSFGRLAVAGELTCITAAVVSLPAFLTFRGRRRKHAQIQASPEPRLAHEPAE